MLHIGWQKTGSTSIQNFLKVNQSRLLEHHRVLYPSAGVKAAGHHRLALCLRAAEQRADTADTVGTADAAWRGLLEELQGEPRWRTAVASSEALRNPEPERLGRVAAMLPADWRVVVVMYVRQPDLLLESQYLQELKGGIPWPSFATFLTARRAAGEPGYARTVAIYREAFPEGRMVVRPFEKEQWPEGDLIADFMGAAGLARVPADAELRREPPENERAPLKLMSLVRELALRLEGERKPGEQGGYGRLLSKLAARFGAEEEPVRFLDAASREALRREFDDMFRRWGISFRRRHHIPGGRIGDVPSFGSLPPAVREELLEGTLGAAVIAGDEVILDQRQAESRRRSKLARLERVEARIEAVREKIASLSDQGCPAPEP